MNNPMATAIDLADEREKRQPHYETPMQCRACGHKWRAVYPISLPNNYALECPGCHEMRGGVDVQRLIADGNTSS